MNGTTHFSTETWTDNTPAFFDGIEDGSLEDLSISFDDNCQGIDIPKYLQEGNPDLQSVQDLHESNGLFEGSEGNSSKAVFYGGPSVWEVTSCLQETFDNEEDSPNLSKHFDVYPLESTATLNATLMEAYDQEDPWVGYNWELPWILGQLDLVLLEDEPDYDSDAGLGTPPAQEVKVHRILISVMKSRTSPIS